MIIYQKLEDIDRVSRQTFLKAIKPAVKFKKIRKKLILRMELRH